LTAEQVERSRGWYDPRWYYENELETRAALDLIASNHFSRNEPDIFTPILDALLQHGDHYRHLADLASYAQAHQRLGELYADQPAWTRKVILNTAASGRFSSDRTIVEYAKEIWQAAPCTM
jgi:starch phosphorylase